MNKATILSHPSYRNTSISLAFKSLTPGKVQSFQNKMGKKKKKKRTQTSHPFNNLSHLKKEGGWSFKHFTPILVEINEYISIKVIVARAVVSDLKGRKLVQTQCKIQIYLCIQVKFSSFLIKALPDLSNASLRE